jgi:SAM-dependent methyltransferase
MSVKLKPAAPAVVVSQRRRCAVCEGALDAAIELPGLPLTDTYCREPLENPLPGIDQRLLYCGNCGHGQLESQIAPDILYGTNYCFRTSASATARKGTKFFLSVLDEAAPGRRFRCVLDLGCNDLFLLSQLKDRVNVRIGVDPVWRGREQERDDQSIILYGSNIEDVPLSALPEKLDLVVCRHTLEHIADPAAVLDKVMSAAAPDALYVFEVPGFDALVSRFRFDQVFHQHLQYFSLASFTRLLENTGASSLLHRENFHDWGAMAVAFARPASAAKAKLGAPGPAAPEIARRYLLFREQMASARSAFAELNGAPIYGYGAAQMLPVLAYHMGTDLHELAAVIDDDPAKDGIGYWNLPVKVVHSARIKDISAASVLITALDNVQPIMTRLLANRPRHIIYPLRII